MTREGFEHAVRASGAVLGVDRLVVIGSQALHASIDRDLPEEALRSVEVDVAVPGDTTGEMADTIDGSIGEASTFHSTFGYYAHGVDETTAVLPDGWRDRLVPFLTPATGGVTALCLEVHDLWISKAIANRPRDLEFCKALPDLVDPAVLSARLAAVPDLDEALREKVRRRIVAIDAR